MVKRSKERQLRRAEADGFHLSSIFLASRLHQVSDLSLVGGVY